MPSLQSGAGKLLQSLSAAPPFESQPASCHLPAAARRQQAALAARVSQADARDWRLGAADSPLRLIGGLDISFLPAPSPDAPVDAGAAAAAGAGGPAGPAAAAVQRCVRERRRTAHAKQAAIQLAICLAGQQSTKT